jgi:hypothetical protein
MSPNTRFSPPVGPWLVGRHAMGPSLVRIGISASKTPSHTQSGPASSCSAVALQEPFVPGRWSWRSAVGTCPAVPTARPYRCTRQSSGIVCGPYYAAGLAVAGSLRPGAWRRIAHTVQLRPVGARWSGSRHQCAPTGVREPGIRLTMYHQQRVRRQLPRLLHAIGLLR